jgi:pumilio RNA-binding family
MPTIIDLEFEDFEEKLFPSPSCLMRDQAMCRRVVTQLKDACPSDRNSLLLWLSTALLDLALSDFSSDVVQMAFEVACGSARTMLVSKLHKAVNDLCVSPHGHLVLTTLIQTMPVSLLGFVASEMLGNGAKLAQHRYSCRVMEAMIMHCSTEQMADLSGELALEAVALAKSTHGYSILRHLLEYGTASCRAQIVGHLILDMPSLAMHRTASCVIEAAFEFSEAQEQRSMAVALVNAANPTSIADVACNRHGGAVLAEIARQKVCEEEMRACLSAASQRLAQSKFGRNVIDCFGLRPRARDDNLEGSNDPDVQLAAAAA